MKKLTLIAVMFLAAAGCKNKASADLQKVEPITAESAKGTGTVIEIKSIDQFNQIIAQKNRLMVFDLYADWCGPCKMLAPVLREVAKTHGADADFYKVNSDSLPQIARLFPSQGIPYVVFFKDSAIMNAITGVYPKEVYEQGVEILSLQLPDSADGSIKEGVRRIVINGDVSRHNIATYKGDKVELTIKATGKPFTVSSDPLKVNLTAESKKDLKVTFDTKELGAFPLVISDSSGRNDRLWVLVSKYEPKQSGGYREVSSAEFSSAMKQPNAVILDVRTPEEFAEGHIAGATLIPVQELQTRLAELESSKSKNVLVYCRSGHRSTVASKILNESGFSSVTNLTGGIKAWQAASLPVEK